MVKDGDNPASPNQGTGRRDLSGDQTAEYAKLLKLSDAVSTLLKVVVEMSDDVKRAASPLDAQGKLLRMQNSIQKNRPRVAKHINDLCDLIDAQRLLDHQSDGEASAAVSEADGPHA